MTDTKQPTEGRVVLPVDPTRRTELAKQRVPTPAASEPRSNSRRETPWTCS
jgi:hypothetical protein